MPQGFHEEKNVRTGVAEKHSKNATKGKQEVISDAEIVPAKFKGLKLENGRYLITRGNFKGKTAFRCPECSRGLFKSGETLGCGVHGVISNPIDLRKIGKTITETNWAMKQYKTFLGEAKDEGFDSVESYVDHLVKTEGGKKGSYADYAKLGIGLEKTLRSKTKPKSAPVKLFDYESVEDAKDELRKGLNFPYVNVNSSILGGKENVSILVTVSKDEKSEWPHHIMQNSCYAQLHIEADGKVEHFAGWRLKLRKFKGKSIEQVIEKINNIKVVE